MVLPDLRLVPLLATVLAAAAGCGGGEVLTREKDAEAVDSADPSGDGGGTGDGGSGATDADGDGYPASDDCDDENPEVNPGTVEVCNGVDDDCDGIVDSDASRQPLWYPDADGDGFGADTTPISACDAPSGHVDQPGDCDDSDADTNPGATDDPCGRPGEDLDCSGAVDEVDADADGFLDCEDCDDSDPEISPGAAERCNGVDDDCDREIDEADAVDAGRWFRDVDGDGFGLDSEAFEGCQPGADWALQGGDCDDADAAENPDADEVCDGDDDDCDGIVDEDEAVDAATWYADSDGDGYGDPSATAVACSAPSGHVADATDCDDREWWTHPGANEICGGGDEDCDGLVDTDDSSLTNATTWYADSDSDGYGDPAGAVDACSQPAGTVADATDCDDSDGTTHPGAAETCDGGDDDCDGVIDEADAVDAPTWYTDADGDGYGDASTAAPACAQPTGAVADATDCDDGDAAVNPGATELWYDGVDGDCDGASDDDADLDGFDAEAQGGTDCDDGDAAVNPAATEVWYDGVDSDCDGASDDDADLDGFDAEAQGGTDCDDGDAAVNPGATELWYDGVDGDCDGWSDDDADLDGFDAAAQGGTDCDDGAPAVHPYAFEDDTNGIDDDCDGDTDTADLDPIYDLGLDATDDAWVEVAVTGVSFPFCGTTHSAFYVATNGLITFGGGSLDYAESAASFTATQAPAITALWDDLSTLSSGAVYGVVHDDAVGFYWRELRELGGSKDLDFAVVLRDDGRILLDYGGMDLTDGLAGWSCGGGAATDLTDAWLDHIAGTAGIGTGTEQGVYEVFSATNPNDTEDWSLHLCGTAGTDSDGDGWTDTCGDPDDTSAAITP